jgi:D-alanyl-D-alanine carboxypeptidase (penicillin-binding protein 5/6)
MSGSRLVTALVTVALAVPVVAGNPSSAPAHAAAVTPPFVPCPVVTPRSPIALPPRPSPPAKDPRRPTVGGDGLATAGLTVPAGAPPPPGNLTATSWMVADLATGAVLGGCGPHEPSPPASVQKLLLAATVLDKVDPTAVIEIVKADLDFERGSSAVGLLLGGHYPVQTLWLGLLLNSGNDAANVLARVGGGDAGVPGTVAAMNAEAGHLGALDTRAVTPSGLDGNGQFTSAYDLALISRADFAREDFRRYTATQRAQIPAQPPTDPRGFQIQNENQLLTQYPGALGGKTGFTDLARHTYVGIAERNGRRLVVSLLGAEAVPLRGWQQGAELLDWGFSVPAGASVGRLVEPGETERAARPPAGGGGGLTIQGIPRTPKVDDVNKLSPGAVRGVTAALGGLVVGLAMLPLIMMTAAARRRRSAVARSRRTPVVRAHRR